MDALFDCGDCTRDHWDHDEAILENSKKRLADPFSCWPYWEHDFHCDTGNGHNAIHRADGGNYYGDNPPCFYGCLRPFDFKRKHYAEKVLVYRSCTIGVGGIIVGNGKIDVTQQLGGLYLLLAALTWALMSVLVKKVPSHYSQIVVTTYTSLIAVMLLTPFVLPRLKNLDLASVLQPTISGGGLLYLGIISTAGGFLLWNKGLQLMNASSGGLFFFFQPIVGTFLGWLLLGETIGLSFWIGSLLIFSGVFIVIRDE